MGEIVHRLLVLFAALILSLCSLTGNARIDKHPAITGVAAVHIHVSDVKTSAAFYGKALGLTPNYRDCGGPESPCFALTGSQFILIEQGRANPSGSLLMNIAFTTSDVRALQKYLVARGAHTTDVNVSESGRQFFAVHDPEGHALSFVEDRPRDISPSLSEVSAKLIHAGIVVHDRAAEDKFYRDILGFHVYWHGGMKNGEDNWVDMQVPDGTDWIEYMLGVPENASHKTLGVMNHIALGVPDIHAAQAQLIKNGFKPTEEPKIGRDGKWQLNLYDPDDTRVELMEFTPTEKPCCAEYTGPHPRP